VPRLIVLDALGLVYRAYYALIGRPLRNSQGENTSAIFGFGNVALKLRREQKPDRWALAWDGPGPTFRHQLFPDYKATRPPMPADLAAQLAPIEELARCLGLPVIEKPGMEADDVMATLARRGAEAGYEVVLVTGDKDMLQVVSDRVAVLAPQARGEDYLRVGPAAVRERWGVGPEHIRDVLALMGDSSDNIPGVPGVGEKTAVELMRQFGSLEALYAGLDEVRKPALKKRLGEHRELAFLSRELATVRADLDLGLGLEQLPVAPIRRDELIAFARRWELRRLEAVADEQGVTAAEAGAPVTARPPEARGSAAEQPGTGVKLAARTSGGGGAGAPVAGLPERVGPPAAAASHGTSPPAGATIRGTPSQGALDLWTSGEGGHAATLSSDELIERCHAVRARALHGLALLPLAGGDDPRTAPLVGLALAARDGSTCYIPLAHAAGPNLPRDRIAAWLAPALADPTVPKVGVDLKRDVHLLAGAGWTLSGLDFDVRIGSFLCDPARAHDLDALAREVLGLALPDGEAGARRGREGPASLAVEWAAPSLAARAAALFPLAEALRAQLESRDQWSLYERLEHPLIPVLVEMERAGVAIDAAQLDVMAARAGEEIARLRGELLAMVGGEVNLESGPQVAKVLFETLGLKPGGRTPSGALSTRSGVLEELAPLHPFPARLLEYRALTKLKSTYFDTLPRVADPGDGRVHTRFDQTGAATGRLSSSDPNLQNIPMRTAQGRAIRRAFVAPAGALLVGADYSQIELRVMAHLSGDPNLIDAFATGQDVHESTARRIFGVAAGPLDPALRARAKVVNFGVMYGMGARSLSQQMGIGLGEAQEFIAGYFKVYARVREFLDRTVEEARGRGFVQTLLGRRRYLPELSSGHGATRAFAERAAINTPIQGSAADLMKLAMIRVHRVLKQRRPSARLLLQVHDELLLECPSAEVEPVSELVRTEMEGCFPLRVPLTVSLGHGPTWFDVH
jgi:DNA polymerase-1